MSERRIGCRSRISVINLPSNSPPNISSLSSSFPWAVNPNAWADASVQWLEAWEVKWAEESVKGLVEASAEVNKMVLQTLT